MATTPEANNSIKSKTGQNAPTPHPRGSGNDLNSDTRRLGDIDNRLDKTDEDSFPASDPPSHTPVSGVSKKHREATEGPAKRAGKDLPPDFKNNGAAQFKYGRESEAKTLHFDTSTKRLYNGNPDIGDVDISELESDEAED